jgi:hypothetical protein
MTKTRRTEREGVGERMEEKDDGSWPFSQPVSAHSRPLVRTCRVHMPRHKAKSGFQARAVDWRKNLRLGIIAGRISDKLADGRRELGATFPEMIFMHFIVFGSRSRTGVLII